MHIDSDKILSIEIIESIRGKEKALYKGYSYHLKTKYLNRRLGDVRRGIVAGV
jgi:hypothetical protein